MGNRITVGISDWKIVKEPDELVTYALGSCIGICLYDRHTSVSGLSHIMLPDSTATSGHDINRMKYADTAVDDMYHQMLKMGARAGGITAKIAGGAVMFATSGNQFNIGERNIAAVKMALQKLRIPIIAEDTGANYGRTVFFYADNGDVEIKSTAKGNKII